MYDRHRSANPTLSLHSANAAATQRQRPDRTAELARCLEETALLPGVDAETCRWLHRKLKDAAFNLVVAGQFKRGKSSLVNALLGEALLPVGVVPLTSVVTVIQFGPTPSASVELRDGKRHDIPLESLADYVTERGNPHNSKDVQQVLVRYPSRWLADGVRLIDTPGIDSVYEHNTGVTRAFLPQADAVIFVASVDQPLSQAELTFLGGIREHASKIFFLLNKIDYLSPAELAESIIFCTQVVHEVLGAVPVFPVSARRAFERQRQSAGEGVDDGLGQFERALQAFMLTDRNTVWRRSAATTLLRLLSQARFILELERSALNTPLEQLESSLRTLSLKKQETLRAQSEHYVLLQAHTETLLRNQIEPSLERFRQEQHLRLAQAMDSWFEELRALSSTGIQQALEGRLLAEIRATYDSWMAREEPEISRAFDDLCGRFWTQMQQSIDELLRHCGDLFGIPLQAIATGSVWRSESGFSYKFWSEPASLRILTSSTVRVLPGFLGGPMILRRLKSYARELIDVHAGRMRSDIEDRLRRSVDDFRARLLASSRSALERIEAAITSGVARHAAGQTDRVERDATIQAAIERIADIEARVRAQWQ